MILLTTNQPTAQEENRLIRLLPIEEGLNCSVSTRVRVPFDNGSLSQTGIGNKEIENFSYVS